MSRECEYKMYSLPSGSRRRKIPIRDRMKNMQRIDCHQSATHFFRSTHQKMLKTHPHGQWLCDDHYKDQKMMQELFEYLDTPKGRRDLFG